MAWSSAKPEFNRLGKIPADIDTVYVDYNPQGCSSFLKKNVINMNPNIVEYFSGEVSEQVSISGERRSQFMSLVEYGPQDMYLTSNPEPDWPKNIYDALKRVIFPQGCKIVVVRNGVAEIYKDTASMPDTDPKMNDFSTYSKTLWGLF